MTFIATRRAAQSRPWTPRDVGVNLSAWYDGQDYSTFTFNSGNVSRWADKSGSGNHLIQNNAGAQPNYGTAIATPSNSQFMQTSGNANIPIGSSPRSVFYVHQSYSGRAGDCFVFQWGTGLTTGVWVNWLHAATDTSGVDPLVIAGTTYSSGIQAAYNKRQMVSCSATATTVTANINGASAINATGLSYSTNAGPLYVARNSDGTRPWNGILSEALILNIAATPSLVQIVEGYLAWKWSLTYLLSASHPYKNTPPRIAA